MKEPLTEFVQNQLQPNDMVAVMYPLTPVDGSRFTRNHASIISAIDHFEGRKFRYEPRNQFEEQYARAPTEMVEQIRNQVVMTALRGLADAARLAARGTQVAHLRQRRAHGDAAAAAAQRGCVDAGQFGNPAASSPMAGENNPREETRPFFAQSDLYSQLRDVFTAANRNNTAIYTLDPRGLATSEFDIDESGRTQAGPARRCRRPPTRFARSPDETDGRAIVNRNDLAKGLQQACRTRAPTT